MCKPLQLSGLLTLQHLNPHLSPLTPKSQPITSILNPQPSLTLLDPPWPWTFEPRPALTLVPHPRSLTPLPSPFSPSSLLPSPASPPISPVTPSFHSQPSLCPPNWVCFFSPLECL